MMFKEKMTDIEVILAVKEAYTEGYSDYSTPCNAYTTFEEEWLGSHTRNSLCALFGAHMVMAAEAVENGKKR